MKSPAQAYRSAIGLACFSAATAFGISNCALPVDESEEIGSQSQELARSANPPGGLTAAQVPQFVAVTFDDNFGADGMNWALGFFGSKTNPVGTNSAATFDGKPVRTSFFHNSTYLNPGSALQTSWQAAFDAGHELADHTVGHLDGIDFPVTAPSGQASWTTEINSCRNAFVSGFGALASDIKGFRAPFLHYNDNTFTALGSLNPAFTYDTSIMGCWATGEGPGNCPWPYTMENGSADADAVFTKWAGRNVRSVGQHPGLWEVPVSVVFVPPDSAAAQYGFTTGLRSRVQALLGSAGNPNFFEQSTGKLVGMDVTMFLDARMTRAEVLATLKYTLDQRLAGNRAPFVFVGHTHVYQSAWDGATATSLADRRGAIEDFVSYALSKPEVRMRNVADIVSWMNSPAALGGTPPPDLERTEGGAVTTSGGSLCNQTHEAAVKAYDDLTSTKWCILVTPSTAAPLSTAYDFAGSDAYAVTRYTITTANDAPTRDPKSWTLQGCPNSSCSAGLDSGWVAVDTRSDEFVGAARGQTNDYTLSNSTAYQQYRIRVTANHGANITQLAEVQMFGAAGTTCTPTTCAAQGKNCGSIPDSCGNMIACGTCSGAQTCGGGGTANVCGGDGGSCSASVPSYTQGKCNATAVFAGKLYKCISQAAGQQGEPTGCGQPGVYCSAIEPTTGFWGPQAWQFVQNCP